MKIEMFDESDPPHEAGCMTRVRIFLRGHGWFLVALLSACCFATSDVVTSTLTGEIGTTELAMLRGIIPSVGIFILLMYQGKSIVITSFSDLKFHFFNSIFTASIIFTNGYACIHMSPADASAIIYGYIVFTGLFGRIFLKEPFALLEISTVALTLVGVFMLVRPPFLFQLFDSSITRSGGIIPPLVAFACALASASQAVTIRAMGRNDVDPVKVIFYPFVFTALVMSVLVTVFGEWSIPGCLWVRIRVLIVVVMGCAANVLMVCALQLENALYVCLVLVSNTLIVLFMTVVFFGYQPPWTSLVGTVLVIGSAVIIIVKKIVVLQRVQKIGHVYAEVEGEPQIGSFLAKNVNNNKRYPPITGRETSV